MRLKRKKHRRFRMNYTTRSDSFRSAKVRSWSLGAISPLSCVATPNSKETWRNAINCLVRFAQVSRCRNSSLELECSSLHNYLTLLQDQANFPCLAGADHYVNPGRRRRSTLKIRKRSFARDHNCLGNVLGNDLSIGERTMHTFQKCQLSNGIERFLFLTFDGIDHL